MPTDSSRDFISTWMALLNQIKLYHWATTDYVIHKALDDLYEELSEKVDRLVEAYLGLTRKAAGLSKFKLQITASSDASAKKVKAFLEAQCKIIADLSATLDSSALVSVVDDIVVSIQRAMYVCRLV
jgi:DNA-binding ferritin-like protein